MASSGSFVAGLLQRRATRYLVVGVANTAFSFGLYCFLIWLQVSVPWASLAALVAGTVVSYTTQGSLVFGGLGAKSAVLFAANWAVMYGLYVALVLAFGRWAGLSPYVGGALATVVTTVVSYFSLRDLVFRHRTRDSR